MWPLCSSAAAPSLPTKPIPGSYGLPVLGPLKDRLDYFWFQGPDAFFRRRMATHGSTVFRTNMPPTFPFFVGVNPNVVALLDTASFSALFDPDLVDKTDVLVGDYSPSLKFTGGTRVVVYLDPSDPRHAPVKSFCLGLLKRSSKTWVSEFKNSLSTMLDAAESDIDKTGSSSFMLPLQEAVFAFLCKSLVGADPINGGHVMLDRWLALQLLPTISVPGFPQPLGELLLHSFPFPFFLASGDFENLSKFIEEGGSEVVKLAEAEYGLSKNEAIHNILFVLGFNAFGGFSIFLPSLITTIGRDKTGLRSRLKEEVRQVISENGDRGIVAAIGAMELVRSTVYEVLRMSPPVPLQYGRARKGFVVSSHDASFHVAKDELLCGYQPLAMRDPEVFEDPEKFVADRFVGEKGRGLLRYLFWSNGPETENPAVGNKQCAAKDYVVLTACLMVAEIFVRYDEFECDDDNMAITKLQKRAT